MKHSDRKLGMGRDITRRDFIHDVTLSVAGLSLPLSALAGSEPLASASPAGERYYPPTRTGLRGSHPGSFETAHALAREGKLFESAERLDEAYDLVVVGGGISGLASAYYYRKLNGPDARILILDNHDDFGGHAKRNEFHQGGRMQLVWGGTINLEFTRFSPTVLSLLDELGVDLKALGDDPWAASANRGSQPGTYFDAATYGRDVFVSGVSLRNDDLQKVLGRIDEFPLGEEARAGLKKFYGQTSDLLEGMSDEQRLAYVHGTSYQDFLRDKVGLNAEAAGIYLQGTDGYWGVGTDSMSVQEALWSGLPGAHRLGAQAEVVLDDDDDSSSVMFPDGNASVARLLVRSMIPAVAPSAPVSGGMQNIVTADFDYARLDETSSNIRLRLNSTAVQALNTDKGVAVSYVRDGRTFRVQANQAVMAGYNMMIPYLCPQLPQVQAEALAYQVKRPMLVTNVLMRNGLAAKQQKMANVYCPGRWHSSVFMAGGVEAGNYAVPWDPEKPTMVQFYGRFGPGVAGLPIREQHRVARQQMLELSFEDYEREVRGVLQGILGPAGFNAADDILAIMVNRWPHGYAYDYLDLWDPGYAPGEAPHEIGRKRFGNIAIANSDAGADAFTHTAIEQAWRAVNELAEARA